MSITTLEVTHLFGLFNHKIELKTKDRITIIHGPNGFGKTAVLRMVDSLFNGRYSVFWETPFATFVVDLTDGTRLQIEKHTPKIVEDGRLTCPVADSALDRQRSTMVCRSRVQLAQRVEHGTNVC